MLIPRATMKTKTKTMTTTTQTTMRTKMALQRLLLGLLVVVLTFTAKAVDGHQHLRVSCGLFFAVLFHCCSDLPL